MVVYNDTTTGRTVKKLTQIPKPVKLCSKEDVGIDPLKEYFKQVNLPLFYCFDNQK